MKRHTEAHLLYRKLTTEEDKKVKNLVKSAGIGHTFVTAIGMVSLIRPSSNRRVHVHHLISCELLEILA